MAAAMERMDARHEAMGVGTVIPAAEDGARRMIGEWLSGTDIDPDAAHDAIMALAGSVAEQPRVADIVSVLARAFTLGVLTQQEQR